MNTLSKTNIFKLKKNDAVKILTDLKLETTGQRPELLARIKSYYYPDKKECIDNTDISKSKEKNKKSGDIKNKSCDDKVPLKSAIKQMKKGDLITKLSKLGLSTNGIKEDLVNRLEEYYRPKNFEKTDNIKEDYDFNIPSKTELRQLNKSELIKKLEKNKLDTSGSRLELFNRLEQFYRPVKEKCNLDIDNEESNEELENKKSAKEITTLELINYDGEKIGVCHDTNRIFEYDEKMDDWLRTKLIWNHELGKPCGY